jgi:hypothetical protein
MQALMNWSSERGNRPDAAPFAKEKARCLCDTGLWNCTDRQPGQVSQAQGTCRQSNRPSAGETPRALRIPGIQPHDHHFVNLRICCGSAT